jgi:hypothetical protein
VPCFNLKLKDIWSPEGDCFLIKVNGGKGFSPRIISALNFKAGVSEGNVFYGLFNSSASSLVEMGRRVPQCTAFSQSRYTDKKICVNLVVQVFIYFYELRYF